MISGFCPHLLVDHEDKQSRQGAFMSSCIRSERRRVLSPLYTTHVSSVIRSSARELEECICYETRNGFAQSWPMKSMQIAKKSTKFCTLNTEDHIQVRLETLKYGVSKGGIQSYVLNTAEHLPLRLGPQIVEWLYIVYISTLNIAGHSQVRLSSESI